MEVGSEQKLGTKDNVANAEVLLATYRQSFMSICHFLGVDGGCYENERQMTSKVDTTVVDERQERLESSALLPIPRWHCDASSSHQNYSPESIEPPVPPDMSRALERYSDIMVDILRDKLSKRGL